MKSWLKFIGVVVALVVALAVTKGFQVKATIDTYAAMPEPESAVSTQKAVMLDWNTELTAIGSLRAVRGVDLSTELAGIVRSANFRSGADVAEGQVLLQLIDDSDVALLHSLQANAELAETSVKRDKLQFDAQAISQAQLDNSNANLKSLRAQVAQQEALVAKKTIRAPFAGQLGISTVNRGQFLNPGDKVVTLQQLDPIYVDFNLPQQSYSQIAVGQKISMTSDGLPGKTFDGEISAVNPIVDTDTRNVRIQATVANPDRKLLPGMFTNVRIAVGEVQHYLTLPQAAVTYNPYGETVFVVVKRGEENVADPNKPPELARNQALDKIDSDQRKAAADADSGKSSAPAPAKAVDPNAPPVLVARQLFITTGPTRGDQVAILSGLTAGDEVVTTGQLKLKNGTRVNVVNDVKMKFDAAPKPQEN